MIHYDLRCGAGHSFDGWFPSSAAFDRQATGGLLDCPVCARTDVARAIMSPRLNKGVRPRTAAAPVIEHAPNGGAPAAGMAVAAPKPVAAPAGGPPAIPDQVRAVLQRLRAEIEQKCDYVGPAFADQARAMHEGAAPHRPIYGETTPEQAEALEEDGIEVARIPWVNRADG